jgi:hypothetical protein
MGKSFRTWNPEQRLFSKSELSFSVGPPGVCFTLGKRGVRETVGIPGTGIYYTRFRRSPRRPA